MALTCGLPGEETDDGQLPPSSACPTPYLVNKAGRRFANEAFYRSVYFAVDVVDGATQTHPNFPKPR